LVFNYLNIYTMQKRANTPRYVNCTVWNRF